jgi:hypothetical protein
MLLRLAVRELFFVSLFGAEFDASRREGRGDRFGNRGADVGPAPGPSEAFLEESLINLGFISFLLS